MSASLPVRPDLDQLRRQAKELLRAVRSGHASSVDRVHAVVAPRPRAALTLSTAQLVIAREHGQPSWPALVAEVHARNQTLIERLTDLVVGSVSGHVEAPGARRRWQDRALRLIADDPALTTYDIRLAAVLGDSANLAAMVDRDPTAATRADDIAGWPPLLFVCSSRWHRLEPVRAAGLVASARVLLDAGADPNTVADGSALAGRCAPLYATSVANHPELASLLIERGADPDTPGALYHAAFHRDRTCLRLLLEHGARAEGSAALGAAISGADTEAVRILLHAGIDPHAHLPADSLGEGYEGAAPVAAVQAAITGRADADLLELLLAYGAEPVPATPSEPSSYQLAARRGDPHLLDVLDRHRVHNDATVIDTFLGACGRGDRASTEGLLQREPNLISHLTDNDHAAIVDAAEHLGVSAVALMLDLGFGVNARRDIDGATALHTAANAGRADVVRLLIASGADIEAHDREFGGTPLSWATVGSGRASAYEPTGDWIDTVTALLDAGANSDGAWVATKPPNDAVAALLIERGIDTSDA